MAHPLEALLVLQEKDRKISKLRREIRDIPSRKAEIETQLEHAKIRLAEARAAQMKVTSDLKQLEVEVAAHREKIDRYKNQQLEAKTNDQYRALLHEVAAEEKAISELEDREIVFMEQLEASKKVIDERDAELKEEEEGIREEQEMLLERLTEVQEDVDSLIEDRRRMAANADASLVSKYERLFANKGDFAVV
ncbi:MAG: hypothetical protein JEZ10_09830, partial [Verrucomicrobia bacterium]|nr:hypothetical protein [Verrucomicrobiota bacterium]